MIQNKENSYVLDIDCGSKSRGTKVLLWDIHEKDNQRWRPKYVKSGSIDGEFQLKSHIKDQDLSL